MLKAHLKKIQRFFYILAMGRNPRLLLAAAMFVWLIAPGAGAAETDDETQYIHLGPIAFSPEYILSKDLDFITFKIKNTSARTIAEIFGWVYLQQSESESSGTDYILVNNPHRGGRIVKGDPHRPGTIAPWRFPLVLRNRALTAKDKFTLRVSPKGIFYLRIEPPRKPGEDTDQN